SDRASSRTRGGADDDPTESLLEVRGPGCECDDRHHLTRGDDDEAVLSHDAISDTTEANHEVAERSIVHVDRARPRDATRIDADRKSTRLNSSHTVISYTVF